MGLPSDPMKVAMNCSLSATSSPLPHLTSMLSTMMTSPDDWLTLLSDDSSVSVFPPLLYSVSPLLSSLSSSPTPPYSIILPYARPGSLPLVRELLYTGQCQGDPAQLEHVLQLLALLGVHIQSQVLGLHDHEPRVLGFDSSHEYCGASSNAEDLELNDDRDKELEVAIMGEECIGLSFSDINYDSDFAQADSNSDFLAHESVEEVLINEENVVNCHDDEEPLDEQVFETENVFEGPRFNDDQKKESIFTDVAEEEEMNTEIMLSDDDFDELRENNPKVGTISSTSKQRFPCNLCEYTATQKGHLKRHILSKHCLERVECNFCGKSFSLQESLRRHIKESHTEQTFPCPECNFVAKRPESLTYHVQCKHSGEIFNCDECEYQAGTLRIIARHKARTHRGVKYACDQCNYETSDKSSLSYHKKVKHEKIRFYCDRCDKKFTKKTSLKVHMQNLHRK